MSGKISGIRLIPEITAEEENFRVEKGVIKRDPVSRFKKGDIVMLPFRITEEVPDCDGSLMVNMECIDMNGNTTGGEMTNTGLYKDSGVMMDIHDLQELLRFLTKK